MERLHLAQYDYVYTPGSADSSRVFILLHGTGGNDIDMLPLGQAIDSNAHLISVHGNVLEHGQARFFRRLSEGVYDLVDLARRTDELHRFIIAAVGQHNLDGKRLGLIGYSNGANIAISLLLKYPKVAQDCIAFRPFFPNLPETPPILDQKNIILLAGQSDPLTTSEQTEALIESLKEYGASVTAHFVPTGHGITEKDIDHTRHWLATL